MSATSRSKDADPSVHSRGFELFQATAALQGAVFVSTGLWPLVSRRTFEAVTGPKHDFWLVRTVGSLLSVTGGVLLSASRKAPDAEIEALGAGTALALAAIDVTYVSLGRISPVYLLDAALELGFVAAWAGAWKRLRDERAAIRDKDLHVKDDARVTEASEESFPASDAPGWGSSTIS